MCNLYRLKSARADIAGLFSAKDRWQTDMVKDYVAPGVLGPVVIEREGQRTSGLMAWGVPNAGKLVTNVRNLDSPFWRNMLDRPHHRCLVPVSEFQEWSVKPDTETGKKRPYWFAIPSRPVFAFAGIWRKVDGEPRFAFLTTEPNALVGAVHPKAMPVVLDDADYEGWLTAPWDNARQMVGAYPSQLMAVIP